MSSNNKFLIFGCLLFAAILLLNTSKVVDAKKSKIIIGSFGGKKHTTYSKHFDFKTFLFFIKF